MNKTSRISVLMSVYNGERYLREAVDSILAQTFEDFEFIIIDDGSTDSTRAILESYDDPRIVIMHHENIGLTKSLNRGLAMARGELIARMDADDVSKPERFEKQVEFMEAHPEVGVLGIVSNVIDEDGKMLYRWKLPVTHRAIMGRMLSGNPMVHSSLIFRAPLLKSLGGYNEEMELAQDYELLLRLTEVAELSNLPECLHRYRLNLSAGLTSKLGQRQIGFGDRARRAYLERRFSREKYQDEDRGKDEELLRLLVINYKKKPGDAILTEYLEMALGEVPFLRRACIRLELFLYVYVRGTASRVVRFLLGMK